MKKNIFNYAPPEIENKSILVVDDFGDMRNMLRSMLLSIGGQDIDLVANGREAVAAAEKRAYDIILCDYNLGPGKNGQQILEEVRHRGLIGLNALFVMITAENTRDMVMGAVEYEPDSYLTKPFTKDMLRSRLEKLLARKRNLEDVVRAVQKGDFEGAIQRLDEKISARPKNLGELVKLKAELCLRAGDFAQAEAVYEEVLASRELPWARLGLGKTYLSMGRLEQAKKVFQELLQDNPQLTAAYDWLARTLLAMGQPTEAQQVLQQGVKVSPKAILRQKALGELATRNGDDRVAEAALGQAVQLSRNSVFRKPALFAALARVKGRIGAGEDGLKVLRDMERAFPGDAEARLYAATVEGTIQQQLGNQERAAACLERATSLYQTLGENVGSGLALELARTCSSLGKTEQAQELLRDVVRNNHAEEELLKDVGSVLGELGLEMDTDAFIGDIRREIVHLNNQGVKLARSGRLDEAVGLFEEAVAGMPHNKVVNLNAARVMVMYMQNHGSDPAREMQVRQLLERVQQLDPHNPALRRVQSSFRTLQQQLPGKEKKA